ncbi:hypothetical protein GAP32_145 [Cronobacter phage vB_CsaM_GAP32]|uniref:Uncharacterized protein n=1 Tax=Cronobacter phage vB_CsaM_GAP32 TaxID=1141136 RepID=K4F9I9_9CAUD|nr:hypothetical protein GAP32_145 [Cronobacter phage vB_CsaM_GAP32]AFC21595.1 hypothetical protein GAP32_145 [Cronobacter phage vB_CsaM_GAP32]
MSKKIIGDMSVQRNAQSNGRNTIRDINNITADVNGNVNLPYYDKEYINKITSVLPISRIGTMDYLPMSINGSFEGATTYYTERLILPVMVENNGTLVYLRPGTNGSTDGYYYCYVNDIRNAVDLTPVLSNEKYIPTTFTANHKLHEFIGSKANEVLFMKTNNGTTDTYTIGLTNGTLNSVSHQYVEFPRSNMGSTDPQYAHIVGNFVYIWCIDSYDSTAAFDISLYTISVANIRSGASNSLTKVTGISGKTIYDDAVAGSIRIAQKYVSTATSDKPFVIQDAGANTAVYQLNNHGVIQAAANNTNTGIRVALFHPFAVNTSFSNSQQYMWGLSFTYNISAKSYIFDKPNAGAIQVSTAGNTIVVNNPYNVRMEDINGFSSDAQGNVPTIYQTADGKLFSTVARYISSPQHKITRASIDNFSDQYTTLNLTTRSLSGITIKYVDAVYGSAVGENLINPTVLSKTRVLLNCSGTENGLPLSFDTKIYTDIGTSTTYPYKSVITGNTINGYAPNVNRHKIDNTDFRYCGLITLVDTDGSIKTYGSTFLEGLSKPANGLMNPNDFTFNGVYTLENQSLLTDLKNSILSSVTHPGNITESLIVLYYIPSTENAAFGKSIAVTSIKTDAPDVSGYNGFVIVSQVTSTATGFTINSLSASNSVIHPASWNVLKLDYTYISRMTGLVIAKYSEFSYIGIPALVNMSTPANASFRSIIGKLDSTNNIVSSSVFTSQYVSAAQNTFEVGVLPDVGFGVFENGNITDYQTKLVFKNHGTSEANLDALIADVTAAPVSRIVVTSQDVAQGFIVYFAQVIPIFMNGRYFEMQPTSIDLTTIDPSPANKTFYVYITIVEGEAEYQISSTLLSEELYRVYIGTIETGNLAITSISTEKVTRFLTYRTSTTKRGSAIPSSTGVPSGTGTRWN